MFPLTVEAAAVSMDEMVWMSLERFLGPADGDEYLEKTFFYCISVCNNLIVNYSEPENGLEEKVFIEWLSATSSQHVFLSLIVNPGPN